MLEGFSLQQGYAELVGIDADSVKNPSHNFQVYFEVEDLDKVYAELKSISNLQWLHEIKEYPWGQRDIRVYDPDKHIVEIAEDMNTVMKRFLQQGMCKAEFISKSCTSKHCPSNLNLESQDFSYQNCFPSSMLPHCHAAYERPAAYRQFPAPSMPAEIYASDD